MATVMGGALAWRGGVHGSGTDMVGLAEGLDLDGLDGSSEGEMACCDGSSSSESDTLPLGSGGCSAAGAHGGDSDMLGLTAGIHCSSSDGDAVAATDGSSDDGGDSDDASMMSSAASATLPNLQLLQKKS